MSVGRRALAALAGEGMQSALHFAANLYLIHSLTPAHYSHYAITVLMAGVNISYINALSATPFQVSVHRLSEEASIGLEKTLHFATLQLALIGGGLTALFLLLLGAPPLVLTVGGLVAGLWPIRVYLKAVFHSKRELGALVIADGSYSTAVLAALASIWMLMSLYSLNAATSILFSLVAGNVVSIIISLKFVNIFNCVMRFRDILESYQIVFRNAAWACVGVTVTNLQTYSYAPLVLMVAGKEPYAFLAACMTLTMPLRIVAGVVQSTMRSEFSRHFVDRSLQKGRALASQALGVLSLAAVALVVVSWMILPMVAETLFRQYLTLPISSTFSLFLIAAVLFLLRAVPSVVLQAAGMFKLLTISVTVGAIISILGLSVFLIAGLMFLTPAAIILSETAMLLHQSIASRKILSEDAS